MHLKLFYTLGIENCIKHEVFKTVLGKEAYPTNMIDLKLLLHTEVPKLLPSRVAVSQTRPREPGGGGDAEPGTTRGPAPRTQPPLRPGHPGHHRHLCRARPGRATLGALCHAHHQGVLLRVSEWRTVLCFFYLSMMCVVFAAGRMLVTVFLFFYILFVSLIFCYTPSLFTS